jgi:hypothetical protein
VIVDELGASGFVVLAVALDSAGAAAARAWIRPAAIAPAPMKMMGWSPELVDRAAAPRFPCVIDERHAVADRYGISNVPTAIWIDEAGTIVRPPENPGASDAFRARDPVTMQLPRDVIEDSRLRRRIYVDAVRDWVARGAGSRHVLAPDEVRRRMRGVDADDSLAAAWFQLGLWLLRHGQRDAGPRALEEAVRLRPDRWRFRRQRIVLEDPALTGQLAATPEFWRAVQALGDRHYYPRTEMDGMPASLPVGQASKTAL